MNCVEFQAAAAEWLEGARPGGAQAHYAACAGCRNLIADMEAIIALAPEVEAATPELPERVWTSLRAQLEAEGIIRKLETGRPAGAGLFDSLREALSALRRPALAGAYALAIFAALVMGTQVSGPGEDADLASVAREAFAPLQPNAAPTLQTVKAVAARNPEVAATYRNGLELVDKVIAMCEKQVREAPNDAIARDYLYQAYQQKAELLSTLVERGVGD